MPKIRIRPPAGSSVPLVEPIVQVSIFTKITQKLLLLTGGAIAVLTGLSFLVSQSLLTQRVFAQLSTLAASREDQLESMLRGDRERVALLARTGEPSSLEHLFKELLEQQVPLLGISLFDHNGAFIRGIGLQSDLPPAIREATLLIPRTGERSGWQWHDVYAPIGDASGAPHSTLALRYNALPILTALFSELSLGDTGEVVLGRRRGNELILLHHSRHEERFHTISLGGFSAEEAVDPSLFLAVHGEEGVHRAYDFRGRDVLVAYRALPLLGWGLVVKVEREEALAGITKLAFTMTAMGVVFLLLAGFLGRIIARPLIAPLLSLAKKIRTLRPGHWEFQRSVCSGDEVEFLDYVINDLTGRLRDTYGHLEDEIAVRTEELRKQYALDRAILESIQHGVISVDAHGVITDVNPATLHLLGFRREELVGKPADKTLDFRHHRGKFEGSQHPVTRCLTKRRVYRPHPTEHVNILRKDETMMPILLIVTPLLHGTRLLGTILVFQDIREERQIDYMKSEFISLASHQLRTPLSALRWYLELLSTDEIQHLSSTGKSYLAELSHATQRMANLLDALLRASRLTGGSLAPDKKPVDLVEFLKQVAEEMRVIAKEQKMSFSVTLPRRALTVKTDATLMRVVLQNLVSNALKYSAAGKTVHLSLRKVPRGVEITVKDRGVGIPKAEQKRIFEKFFRAKNVRQMDTDGSGLGLYITQTIIESLGGKISFVSVEGKGTTFTVRLS